MRAGLLVASLLMLPAATSAHGVHTSPLMPINSNGPLARGAREALSCDGEIYDSVFEYDLCLESRRSAVAPSADDSLGFWLIAVLRVHGAADNGYPEAQIYLARYRERLNAMRLKAHAPVIEALCQALGLPCPSGL